MFVVSFGTGPGLLICGTDGFYNVDVHSVYLIWSLNAFWLQSPPACIIDFNPGEVPSDSLFLKQCDSVS